MSVISHGGEDYGIPTVEIQDDASATTLDATKVPTGQTIDNYITTNLRTSNATGVITKLTTNGTLDMALCVKIGDLVIASGRIHTINPTVAASGDFFQLPAGFRPARKTYGYGYMILTGPTNTSVLCTISTAGNVNLVYSASSQTGQVGFFAVFPTV